MDAELFTFRSLATDVKISIEDSPLQLPKYSGNISLLACSSKYGFIVAGTTRGFMFGESELLRSTFYGAAKTTTVPFESTVHIDLAKTVRHVRISADQTKILIGVAGGDMFVYTVKDIVDKRFEAKPRKLFTLNEEIMELLPNPKTHPDIIAIAFVDGSCAFVNLITHAVTKFPGTDDITAIAWSQLGKQIVCGRSDGLLERLDVNCTVHLRVPAPVFPGTDNGNALISKDVRKVVWIRTNVFLVVYCEKYEPGVLKTYIVEHIKATDFEYTEIHDAVSSAGGSNANLYAEVIRDFGPEIPNIVFLSNAADFDIIAIGQNEEGEWALWDYDEASSIALPLSDNKEMSTYPVGIATDFSIVENARTGFAGASSMPVLYYMNNEGRIGAYRCCNWGMIRRGEKYAGMTDVIDVNNGLPLSNTGHFVDIIQPANNLSFQDILSGAQPETTNVAQDSIKLPTFAMLGASQKVPKASDMISTSKAVPVFGVPTMLSVSAAFDNLPEEQPSKDSDGSGLKEANTKSISTTNVEPVISDRGDQYDRGKDKPEEKHNKVSDDGASQELDAEKEDEAIQVSDDDQGEEGGNQLSDDDVFEDSRDEILSDNKPADITQAYSPKVDRIDCAELKEKSSTQTKKTTIKNEPEDRDNKPFFSPSVTVFQAVKDLKEDVINPGKFTIAPVQPLPSIAKTSIAMYDPLSPSSKDENSRNDSCNEKAETKAATVPSISTTKDACSYPVLSPSRTPNSKNLETNAKISSSSQADPIKPIIAPASISGLTQPASPNMTILRPDPPSSVSASESAAKLRSSLAKFAFRPESPPVSSAPTSTSNPTVKPHSPLGTFAFRPGFSSKSSSPTTTSESAVKSHPPLGAFVYRPESPPVFSAPTSTSNPTVKSHTPLGTFVFRPAFSSNPSSPTTTSESSVKPDPLLSMPTSDLGPSSPTSSSDAADKLRSLLAKFAYKPESPPVPPAPTSTSIPVVKPTFSPSPSSSTSISKPIVSYSEPTELTIKPLAKPDATPTTFTTKSVSSQVQVKVTQDLSPNDEETEIMPEEGMAEVFESIFLDISKALEQLESTSQSLTNALEEQETVSCRDIFACSDAQKLGNIDELVNRTSNLAAEISQIQVHPTMIEAIDFIWHESSELVHKNSTIGNVLEEQIEQKRAQLLEAGKNMDDELLQAFLIDSRAHAYGDMISELETKLSSLDKLNFWRQGNTKRLDSGTDLSFSMLRGMLRDIEKEIMIKNVEARHLEEDLASLYLMKARMKAACAPTRITFEGVQRTPPKCCSNSC
ncbi:hypothetical protein DFQ28_009685 [Apophysomyces sp. BC1034]|nr:hypothetical protein DFQ30_009486 [Apophysomyces sp. BC1015]KAG0172515.1 hypothetical protein DFQ29_008334 [Apophysomyces sp. BC1021]KAG0185230.1 hypothetical protein DFQ28_009685 [Apophysomyces sp. BC1034]